MGGRCAILLNSYLSALTLAGTVVTVNGVSLCVVMRSATRWKPLMFDSDARQTDSERSLETLAEYFGQVLLSLEGIFEREHNVPHWSQQRCVLRYRRALPGDYKHAYGRRYSEGIHSNITSLPLTSARAQPTRGLSAHGYAV